MPSDELSFVTRSLIQPYHGQQRLRAVSPASPGNLSAFGALHRPGKTLISELDTANEDLFSPFSLNFTPSS